MVTEVGIGFLFFWKTTQSIKSIEQHYNVLNECVLNRDYLGILNISSQTVDENCTVYTPYNIVTGNDYFTRVSNQIRDAVQVLASETKIKEVYGNGLRIRVKVFYRRQTRSKEMLGDSKLITSDSKRLTHETWQFMDRKWKLVELKVLKRETIVDGYPL
jgi:hypothetical protein